MALHIDVLHPAWATLAWRPFRKPETLLVKASTPASVPESDERNFAPTGIVPWANASPLLYGEGSLWQRVEGNTGPHAHGPVRPEQFARDLSVDLHLRPGIWYFQLIRTPLIGVTPSEAFSASLLHNMGAGFDFGYAREVHEDGREAASAFVRVYLREQFRVVGDTVLRRWRRPVLVRTGEDRAGFRSPFAEYETTTPFVGFKKPGLHEWYDLVSARPSSLHAILHTIPRTRRPKVPASVMEWLDLGDEVADARDGAWLFEAYGQAVGGIARRAIARRRRDDGLRLALEASLRGLEPLNRASLVGMPDELVGVGLEALSNMLRLLDGHRPKADPHAGRRHLAAWIEDVHMPCHHGIPADDVTAIGALAPG